MIVILTEKSSACKNFEKALGGISGTYNGEEYKLVHSHGHLFELKNPEELVSEDKAEQYKTWDTSYLPWNISDFRWEKQKKQGATDTLKTIREAVKTADEVVIATDDDPSGEGELLAWEILDDIRWNGKTSRMYFEDESPKEIQKAFVKRKNIPSMLEDGDYIKAVTRERWDYLSMQLTRAATLSVPDSGSRHVIRQGRLKSVMTYLIGKQLDAYNNYVKVPFFEARYKDENGHIYKREASDDIRFKNKNDVDLTPYSVSDVIIESKEIKKKAPGKLLDLASISAILAAKGYKSKEVLDTYQKMYQDHILSYPRTEDKYITIEQFNELLPLVDDIAALVDVSPALLTHREPRKTHIRKGMAHGANRPGTTVPESLDDLSSYGRCAKDLYEIVAKNYLSILGEDYEYEQQKGYVKDHPEFRSIANIPVKQGFKAIFDSETSSKEKNKDEEPDNNKPLGTKASPFVYEGCNPRPQRPTQKWLVGKLEKYNVGTGATRTQTISDISTENDINALITVKKGVLDLTECGSVSYHLLDGCDIASAEVTEKLFSEMEDVGKFEKNPDEVISTITPIVTHDMEIMQSNAKKEESQFSGIGKCPVCGGSIIQTKMGFSCSNYKETGCKFTIWNTIAGKKISDTIAKELLSEGQTSLIKGFKTKDGKSFDAMLKIAENGEIKFAFPERKVLGKCPVCGKNVIEGNKGYGCSGYKEGCKFVIWKTVADKKLSEKNVKDLLEKGKTDIIKGFKSKTGKEFSAALKLDDSNSVVFDFPETGKVLGRCPCCGEDVTESSKAFSCSNDDCDFIIWKNVAGHTLSFDEAKELLDNGKTQLIKGFKSKKGKSFNAFLYFDDDNKVQFQFEQKKEESFSEEDAVGKCPVCGRPVYETDKAYSCSGYSDGCSFGIWKTISGKKITLGIAKKILEKGHSGKLDGFKSKKGKPFSADIVLGDDGSTTFEF